MSRAGWLGGEVEGFEVVEVGLDLGAEVGAVAEVVEDLDYLVHGFQERVGDAWGAEGAGEGDVDSLLDGIAAGAAGSLACNNLLNLRLELIEADAEGFFGPWWGGL